MKSTTIDLGGRRFGQLSVLGWIAKPSINKGSKSLWLCRCDCGSESGFRTHSLTSGLKTKCRRCAIQMPQKQVHGPRKHASSRDSVFAEVVTSYKSGARSRTLEFRLTTDVCYGLFESDCSYCGSPPSNVKKSRFEKFDGITAVNYNGIDRIDNNIGYTLDNVVAACARCNYAKSTYSADDFILWATRVNYFCNKNPIDGRNKQEYIVDHVDYSYPHGGFDINFRHSQRKHLHPKQEIHSRQRLQYRRSSQRVGRRFELADDICNRIFDSKCYYCDGHDSKKTLFFNNICVESNGIDRIDNDQHYTLNNVVPACQMCNFTKSDMPIGEFMDWTKKISVHRWIDKGKKK